MNSNRIKTVVHNSQIQKKFNNFLVNNVNENNSVDRLVEFCSNYRIIINDNLDDFEMGYKNY